MDKETFKTYPNECVMECEGARKQAEGECEAGSDDDCIVCPLRQPQCAKSCRGKCEITKQTCDACSEAICHDDGSSSDATCEVPLAISKTGFVYAGWQGRGAGDNFCNKCSCRMPITTNGKERRMPLAPDEDPEHAGEFSCTEMDCSQFDTKPEIKEGCRLQEGDLVRFGWSGNDNGDNYCNRCSCRKPTKTRRKPFMAGGDDEDQFTQGFLVCTKMQCEPRDGKGGVVSANRGDLDLSLTSFTSYKYWDVKCKTTVCRNDISDCGACKYEEANAVADTCKRMCKASQDVDAADKKKEEANSLVSVFGGIREEVQTADEVDAKGIGEIAAGIQAKCAAFTKDCRGDDVECACPAEVKTVIKQFSEGRSVDAIAKKLECCRDVGGKDAATIKSDLKAKIEAFIAGARDEGKGLEAQIAECVGDGADGARRFRKAMEDRPRKAEDEAWGYCCEGNGVCRQAEGCAGSKNDCLADPLCAPVKRPSLSAVDERAAADLCEQFAILKGASSDELDQAIVLASSILGEDTVQDLIDSVIDSGAHALAGSAFAVAMVAAAVANM